MVVSQESARFVLYENDLCHNPIMDILITESSVLPFLAVWAPNPAKETCDLEFKLDGIHSYAAQVGISFDF